MKMLTFFEPGVNRLQLHTYYINYTYCNKNPICVFSGKELSGLSPNFHIYVSVGDLYIPRIGPPIFLQQSRQTDRGNI
jgi:hypothetical protein